MNRGAIRLVILVGIVLALTGCASGDFGDSVLDIGDINGDTLSDLAVTDPYSDTGASNGGAVYIFHGPFTGVDELAPADADVTVLGDLSNGFFGTSIAAADIDGDNMTDLLVGTPGEDDGGGRIYVFSGSGLTDMNSSDADHTILGGGDLAGLGTSLATGNFNGDDHIDVIAGCGIAPIGNGLQGFYYDSDDHTELVFNQTDAQVDFDWGSGTPAGLSGDEFSVRWTGVIDIPEADSYTFYLNSDDDSSLWLGGTQIIDNQPASPPEEVSATVFLNRGQYDIRIDHSESGGDAEVHFYWSSGSISKEIVPSGRLTPLGPGRVVLLNGTGAIDSFTEWRSFGSTLISPTFGSALEADLDLDTDGASELFIGAWGMSKAYYLNINATIWDGEGEPDYNTTFFGKMDGLGYSLASRDDGILIGAPFYNCDPNGTRTNGTMGYMMGAVFLKTSFQGGEQGAGRSASLWGFEDGGMYGSSVEYLMDDTTPAYLVGAPNVTMGPPPSGIAPWVNVSGLGLLYIGTAEPTDQPTHALTGPNGSLIGTSAAITTTNTSYAFGGPGADTLVTSDLQVTVTLTPYYFKTRMVAGRTYRTYIRIDNNGLGDTFTLWNSMPEDWTGFIYYGVDGTWVNVTVTSGGSSWYTIDITPAADAVVGKMYSYNFYIRSSDGRSIFPLVFETTIKDIDLNVRDIVFYREDGAMVENGTDPALIEKENTTVGAVVENLGGDSATPQISYDVGGIGVGTTGTTLRSSGYVIPSGSNITLNRLSRELWSAANQTGGAWGQMTWATNTVSWRIPISGSSIVAPSERFRLYFNVRSDLMLAAVRIAEMAGGNPLNVVEGTWTNITFSGNQYIEIPGFWTIQSDLIEFMIEPSKDYVITFYVQRSANLGVPYYHNAASTEDVYYMSGDYRDRSDWTSLSTNTTKLVPYITKLEGFDHVHEGSIYSTMVNGSASVDYTSIWWNSTVPDGTELELQFRSAEDKDGRPYNWTGWYGASGADSYYMTPGANISDVHDGRSWSQYRAVLRTYDREIAPILHDVAIGGAYAQTTWSSGPGLGKLNATDPTGYHIDRGARIVMFSLAAPSGNVNFTVTADPAGGIPESDETNNVMTRFEDVETLATSSPYWLNLTILDTDGVTPAKGADVTIAQLRTGANSVLSANSSLAVDISTIFASLYESDDIDITVAYMGASASRSFKVYTADGEYNETLRVELEGIDLMFDMLDSQSPSGGKKQILIYRLDESAEIDTPVADKNHRLEAVIKNRGSILAQDVTAQFYINGSPLGDPHVFDLSALDTHTITEIWKPAEGTYNVTVRMEDAYGEIKRGYLDLWDSFYDLSNSQVDFTTEAYNTVDDLNTFWIASEPMDSHDGWDFGNGVYGASDTTHIRFGDPAGARDYQSNGRLEIKMAGEGIGQATGKVSGGWGVQIYIDNETFDIIEDGGSADIFFIWNFENFDDDLEEDACIVASFGNDTVINWLGGDSNPFDWDNASIWRKRSKGQERFNQIYQYDLAEYINHSGFYYLSMGGILEGTSWGTEGMGAYFDDVSISITEKVSDIHSENNRTGRDVQVIPEQPTVPYNLSGYLKWASNGTGAEATAYLKNRNTGWEVETLSAPDGSYSFSVSPDNYTEGAVFTLYVYEFQNDLLLTGEEEFFMYSYDSPADMDLVIDLLGYQIEGVNGTTSGYPGDELFVDISLLSMANIDQDIYLNITGISTDWLLYIDHPDVDKKAHSSFRISMDTGLHRNFTLVIYTSDIASESPAANTTMTMDIEVPDYPDLTISEQLVLQILPVLDFKIKTDADKSGDPGSARIYSITIESKANTYNVVNLSVATNASAGWVGKLDNYLVGLPMGDTVEINLTVWIPEVDLELLVGLAGEIGHFTVSGISYYDENVTDNATTMTTVNLVEGLEIDPGPNVDVYPGSEATITYELRNTGNGDLNVTPAISWNSTYGDAVVNGSSFYAMGPNETANVRVTINASTDLEALTAGKAIEIVLSVMGEEAPGRFIIGQVFDLGMNYTSSAVLVPPGESETEEVLLVNSGNGYESVLITRDSGVSWINPVQPAVEIGPRGSLSIGISITPPLYTSPGLHYSNITFTGKDGVDRSFEIRAKVTTTKRVELVLARAEPLEKTGSDPLAINASGVPYGLWKNPSGDLRLGRFEDDRLVQTKALDGDPVGDHFDAVYEDGSIYIIWSQLKTGTEEVLMQRYDISTNVASFPEQITPSDKNASFDPSIDVEDGNVYVMWLDEAIQGTGSKGTVMFASKIDGSWIAPVEVTADDTNRAPFIRASGLDIYGTWISGTGASEIGLVKMSTIGAKKVGPMVVPGETGLFSEVMLVINGDQVMLAWADDDVASTVFYNSGTWSETRHYSGDGIYISHFNDHHLMVRNDGIWYSEVSKKNNYSYAKATGSNGEDGGFSFIVSNETVHLFWQEGASLLWDSFPLLHSGWGKEIEGEFHVHNYGNIASDVDLSAELHDNWTFDTDEGSMKIDPDGWATIPYTLKFPIRYGEYENTTLVASIGLSDPERAVLRTYPVGPETHEASLVPINDPIPGVWSTVRLELTNVGNVDENITVDMYATDLPDGWTVHLNTSGPYSLGPQASTLIDLRVMSDPLQYRSSGTMSFDINSTSIDKQIDMSITAADLAPEADIEPASSNLSMVPLVFRSISHRSLNDTWHVSNGMMGNGTYLNITFLRPGTYTVQLRSSNPSGTDTMTIEYVVINRKPVPSAVSGDTIETKTYELIELESTSRDPDGAIVHTMWEIKGIGSYNGTSLEHMFISSGSYEIVLTVTDDSGDSNSTSILVIVNKGKKADTTDSEDDLSSRLTDLSAILWLIIVLLIGVVAYLLYTHYRTKAAALPAVAPITTEDFFEEVSNLWDNILDHLVLTAPEFTEVLEGSRPIHYEPDTKALAIGVLKSPRSDIALEPGNLSMIEDKIDELLDRRVFVDAEILEGAELLEMPASGSRKKSPSRPGAARPKGRTGGPTGPKKVKKKAARPRAPKGQENADDRHSADDGSTGHRSGTEPEDPGPYHDPADERWGGEHK